MIVFPREMPTRGAAQQEFEVQRVDYGAPEAGGRIGGVQAGFPLWMGVWTLGTMGQDSSDVWRGWLSTLRGSQRHFYAHDFARPFPKAHLGGFAGMARAGGGAFGGSATSWVETLDAAGNSQVTLHGLPVGLVLGNIDYIGFKWDAAGDAPGTYARRALVRVVDGGGGVANGSGDLTVTSEPPVPSIVPSGAIAHLDQPRCLMKIVGLGSQTKLGPVARSLAVTGGTVVGIQDLLP